MMDSFESKHKMVQQLLDMLKSHASNEVSTGLQHPEGEGDMHGIQAERVEVIPDHGMDEPTPEHDVVTHELNTGGMVPDSTKGEPDKEGSAHEEATESESERKAEGDIEAMPGATYAEAASEPPSMFASFLGKRKKK
jgi:hypothetical protein